MERLISAGGLEPLIAFQSFNESEHVRFESCRVVALLYKKSMLSMLGYIVTYFQSLRTSTQQA